MNLKIKTFLRILIILTMTVNLLACSSQAKPVSTVIIASASKGGVWNPLAKEMARILPQYVPGVTFSDQETLGSLDNLKLLVSGKAQIVFAHDYHIARINQGLLTSISASKVPVKILMGLYDQPLQIVIRKDAGINTLADLKGKRVSTGIPGGCAEEMAGFVLKSMNIDIDKDVQRQKLDVLPSAAAIKDNQIDAFFWTGAMPTGSITKLFAENGSALELLSVDSASAELIMKDNPGVYHLSSVPAGGYPGLEKPIETLGITAVLASLDTFPAELVSQVLPALFDHRQELSGVWGGATKLSPFQSMNMLSDEALSFLHPAATGYYLANLRTTASQKEIGELWISKCMEAGHDGPACADSLLKFLKP